MSAPPPRSGERDAPQAPVALIIVIAVMLAIRLNVAASVHLTEDEAYYRLWSMTPALGYYDHPPMIAWWVWAGRSLIGDTALGVRLVPILAAAASSLLVHDLTRLAGGDRRTAERAGIWYNAMPLIAGGGALAVPDAPASLFWILTLWCALKARGVGAAHWWLAAGVAAGLATLSKYSALFLAPGFLLWFIWSPKSRAQLRGPGPWLAAILALAIFSLNIAWNADHHWLTFAKQFGRVAADHFAPHYLAELVLTQTLLINPLLASFFLRRRRGDPTPEAAPRVNLAPFLATSAPFAIYLLVHSLHDRVQAHWPAPLYPALAICAAALAARVDGSATWSRVRTAVPFVGLGAFALGLALLLAPAGLLGRRLDPGLPVRGWPDFTVHLDALRTAEGAAWIATTSYGLAAELAAEPGLHAPVFQLAERDRYVGLVSGAGPHLERPGLVIDLPRRIDPAVLARCFAQVRALGTITRGAQHGTFGKAYSVFIVSAPLRDVIRNGC